MSRNRAKSAKNPWSFEDLVDFEYAIRLESTDSPDEIDQRDRKVLEKIEEDNLDLASNRDLLKVWLESVKASLFPNTWNPGEVSYSAISLANKFLLAMALVTGLVTAAGFLSYEGSEPVNVSAYVGVFVVLQLALAVVTLLLIFLVRWVASAFDCFLGIRILRPLFFHFAASLMRYVASRMDSKHRSVVMDASGDLKSLWTIYRPLLQRKAFAHFQAWAIAFNLGLIGATLIIVLFSDRAFGWQTTLQVDAEWLYQVVRITSSPWSWFAGEGVGYPSLSEIEGSRIILKDGIRSLNSEDLVSWWPYLSLGTIVYGLLPRIVFYSWGSLASRYCLKRLSFSHVEANRIAERIRSRDIGFDTNADRSARGTGEPSVSASNEVSQLAPASDRRAVCLLASDYHEELSTERLKSELARTLNRQADQLDLLTLTAEDQLNPENLGRKLDSQERGNLFIVFASWLPPIEETRQLIRTIRKIVGSDRALHIELLGQVDSKDSFQDPKPQDVSMWKTFVRRLGDPYCGLNLSTP